MVWNLETMVPTFSDYDNQTLPLKDLVFNRDKLFSKAKDLVQPSEDYDKDDKLKQNQGMWFLDEENFNIILLYNMSGNYHDDEIVQMQLDTIPNSDQFVKLYVEPTVVGDTD